MFDPADGEKARWRHLYDMVTSRQPGDEITYREAEDALQCNREQALAAMNEARRHLENDKQRTVRTVTKFGWIIVDARGNLDIIEQRRKKAGRAVTRTIRGINATPRDELSQIEKARLDSEARNALMAQSLYSRKSREFAELERTSKRQTELPFRKPDTA